jgi:hypothetical protein
MPGSQPQVEVVRLQGGPRDGATYGWRGADEIRFSVLLPDGLSNAAVASNLAQSEEYIYRRSLVTRHIFVFQP